MSSYKRVLRQGRFPNPAPFSDTGMPHPPPCPMRTGARSEKRTRSSKRPSSEVYPQFEAGIRARIDGWYGEGAQEEEED